jgi:cell wall-associated NlpC family hydrolase
MATNPNTASKQAAHRFVGFAPKRRSHRILGAAFLGLSVPLSGLASVAAQTISTIPVQAGVGVAASTIAVSPGLGKVVVAAAATDVPVDTRPVAVDTKPGEAKVEIKADVKTPRYSDAVADLAAETLRAMKDRGIGGVPASTANAATPTAASSEVSVQTVSGTQTQVVGGTPVASAAPTSPASAGSVGWTSTVISTDQLSDYYTGNAVEVPVAPTTQTILAKLPTDPTGRYNSALRLVAQSVASRIKGAKAADLETVWLRTDDRRMTVILTALAQVGTSYRYTGNQPGGFDCSGLTSYSWAKAGIKIPRVSGDQINAFANKVQADLMVGDLLYRPGHIGLYLGVNDYMVHSPQTGKWVEVKPWGKVTRFASPL